MVEQAETRSTMSITGKSALQALGIAIIGVLLLTVIYTLMGAVFDMTAAYFETNTPGSFELESAFLRAIDFVKTLGICAGPVIFLLTFALLQRFRIR
ncbi:MAG: hypothetical protein QUS14_04515 [Pyrinomonadaceae bacterium]|nr:hypothetical protein [Pyrinomonadaceae bacterium]